MQQCQGGLVKHQNGGRARQEGRSRRREKSELIGHVIPPSGQSLNIADKFSPHEADFVRAILGASAKRRAEERSRYAVPSSSLKPVAVRPPRWSLARACAPESPADWDLVRKPLAN